MINFITLAITQEQIDSIIEFHISSEVFYSLIVMICLIIFSIIIGLLFKKAMKDPLKTPKGLIFVMYTFVNSLENFVVSIMGEKGRKLTGYFLGLTMYLFLSFAFGLTGLSSPFTYIVMPLSISLVTFLLIHITAARENKWGYFKRYIDPIPILLPINLLTMWAPLLSLTLRLFGNALSGYCIMSLVYAALEALSSDIFRPIFGLVGVSGIQGSDIILAPFITPILHVYFDLFSSFIQTLVFSMLTMIFIAQEQNEDEEDNILENVQLEVSN